MAIVRHSSMSPKQQRRPLSSLLSDSSFMFKQKKKDKDRRKGKGRRLFCGEEFIQFHAEQALLPRVILNNRMNDEF